MGCGHAELDATRTLPISAHNARLGGHISSISQNAVSGHSPSRSLPIGALDGTTNGSDMAAGDPQRVWFPEMIARLRFQWHQGMSFDAIIELRDELDTKLQQIRFERHIRSPVFRCP